MTAKKWTADQKLEVVFVEVGRILEASYVNSTLAKFSQLGEILANSACGSATARTTSKNLVIKVVDIKGCCPVYRKGDTFRIEESYKLEADKLLCMHSLQSLMPYHVPLSSGIGAYPSKSSVLYKPVLPWPDDARTGRVR